MCLEHSNVNFGYQGALSVSQCDGGTNYGTTRVCTMSLQSFKAVASIVWVGGPKISIVHGHHYACLDWNIQRRAA